MLEVEERGKSGKKPFTRYPQFARKSTNFQLSSPGEVASSHPLPNLVFSTTQSPTK
jgi:hypothetical protein